MKKRFLENISFFLALNLIIKPIYVFGIDRVVQNTVGTETYGSYFALLNMVLIFQIILDLGIENFTRKEIAHKPERANIHFSNFLVLKFILIFFFILTLSISGLFLPQSKNEWRILVLLLVNQSLANLIMYTRSNLGGLQLFKKESLVSVFDRLFMIIICGALLILPRYKTVFKIEWFVFAQTTAYIITLVISFYFVIKKTGIPRFRNVLSNYMPVIKKLRPYATLVLLMGFYYRIDSILLRFLLPDGKEQAGIFAHGFRILDFMSNYALIFSFILLPTFASLIRNKKDIAQLLRLASITLIIPSLAFLSAIIFYRYEVFELLYKDHIQLSANTFLILIISYLGMCFSYTYGALLTANGSMQGLNTMAVIATIISIALNLLLIPRYKVIGAAIANASAQSFTILFHYLYVRKKFGIPLNLLVLAKTVVFLALSIGTAYLISKTNLNWILAIGTITLVSLGLSVAIGLIKVSGIKTLFQVGKLE